MAISYWGNELKLKGDMARLWEASGEVGPEVIAHQAGKNVKGGEFGLGEEAGIEQFVALVDVFMLKADCTSDQLALNPMFAETFSCIEELLNIHEFDRSDIQSRFLEAFTDRTIHQRFFAFRSTSRRHPEIIAPGEALFYQQHAVVLNDEGAGADAVEGRHGQGKFIIGD